MDRAVPAWNDPRRAKRHDPTPYRPAGALRAPRLGATVPRRDWLPAPRLFTPRAAGTPGGSACPRGLGDRSFGHRQHDPERVRRRGRRRHPGRAERHRPRRGDRRRGQRFPRRVRSSDPRGPLSHAADGAARDEGWPRRSPRLLPRRDRWRSPRCGGISEPRRRPRGGLRQSLPRPVPSGAGRGESARRRQDRRPLAPDRSPRDRHQQTANVLFLWGHARPARAHRAQGCQGQGRRHGRGFHGGDPRPRRAPRRPGRGARRGDHLLTGDVP